MNPTKSSTRHLFAGVVLAVATVLSATASSANLIDSGSIWYGRNANNANNFTLSDNQLSTTTTGSGSDHELLTYIAPVSLAVGETFTLSFTYSLDPRVNTVSGLRFGLFNSNGTDRVAANGYTNAGANNSTGYFIVTQPGPTVQTDRTRLYSRDSTSSANLIAGSTLPVAGGNTGWLDAHNTVVLTEGASYSGVLSVSYLAEGQVSVTYSFNGTDTYTWTSGTGDSVITSFNTVGISLAGNNSGSTGLKITSLSYEVTAVPEPATVGLFVGAGALGLAFLRRR